MRQTDLFICVHISSVGALQVAMFQKLISRMSARCDL